MAKATKLPSGNYRCLASKTINGVRYRKSFTAELKKDAERMAAAWESNGNVTERSSLKCACERYIAERDNIVSPVTIETYRGYMRRYLTAFMHRSINGISASELQIAFNDMAGYLSPKTLNSVYGFYRSVFARCGIEIKIKTPPMPKRTYNIADVETAKRILQIIKGNRSELPIILAMCYGLRISEICGLKWEDITVVGININKSRVNYGGKYYDKSPKTAAGVRVVPISKEHLKLFNEKRQAPEEYVYTFCPATIRRDFDAVLKENGLSHYNIHSLRHTFASILALANVPKAYTKEIGGWETDAVLSKVYEQTFADQQKAFMEKAQNIFLQ